MFKIKIFMGFSFFLLLVLVGCKSTKKRLAEFHAKYPCPQTGRIDTIVKTSIDSVPYYIEGKVIKVKADCPPSPTPPSPTPSVQYITTTIKGDTVYLRREKQFVVNKIYYEDSFKIDSMRFVVQKELLGAKTEMYDRDKELVSVKKGLHGWKVAAILSWALILAAGVFIGLSIKKR